jgi:hypothetical protein
MIGLKMPKANFFTDANPLLKALDKAKRDRLSKTGAILRQSMRQSMRRRKKASPPGQPPSAHGEGRGPLLKERLFFVYEPSTESVITGPEALRGSKSDAPELQERGGTVQRSYPKRSPTGRKLKSAAAKAAFLRKVKAGQIKRERVTRTVKVDARPYAGPALAREDQKLVGLWADAVK